MTCEEFTQTLTAFSLNELGPRQTMACRNHLGGCARCTNLALRDHRLVSILRASAVPAPAAVHHAVAVALRQEGRGKDRRRRRPLRVVIAGLAAAAAVVAALVVPSAIQDRTAPDPLAAAWDAYNAPRIPFDSDGVPVPAALSGKPLPDLSAIGLYRSGDGRLWLDGQPALAAEYRGDSGERLAVFRWEGHMEKLTGDGDYQGHVITSTWDDTTSSWWEVDGVVFCAVGNLQRQRLDGAVERIRGALSNA